MYDIVFVILVYNLLDEVDKCIASISNMLDTKKYKFVIVDNGSTDNIGKRIFKKYESDDFVIVKCLPENIGFAKGNNIGITIARSLGAKYICCLNDDTRLLSNNLVQTLNDLYESYRAALIGPKIIERNGNECDFNHELENIDFYERKLYELKNEKFDDNKLKSIIYGIKGLHVLKPIRYVWHLIHKVCFAKKCKYQNNTPGLILQGSCLFFTPIFFEQLDGFYPDTFLYYEEHLLYAMIATKKLTTLYTPQISFLHLRGVSTVKSLTQRKKIWMFTQKHYIESLSILIKYLKSHQEEIYYEKPLKK